MLNRLRRNGDYSGFVRLTLVSLGAALMPVSPAAAQQPPTPVHVDAVRTERLGERRLVTGELRALRRAKVASEEQGLIIDLPVRQGQRVKAGDVLARLEDAKLHIELRQIEADAQAAQALLIERQADLEWRRRDIESYRNLAQGGASNPKELSDAEMAERIAVARIMVAERGVALARARADMLTTRLADMTIAAPFDGIVVAKLAEQGEWVVEGGAVVELVSSGSLEAWLDVPQKYAGAVFGAAGQAAAVQIEVEATGASLQSTHLRSVPVVESSARTFMLVASLDDQGGSLAPGMSVTAWVPTGETGDRLTVPRNAVMRNDTGAYVYVVRALTPDAPPAAMPARVQVQFAHDDRVAVRSTEIAAGDHVVVEGNERLFPMMPVQPILVGHAAGHRDEGHAAEPALPGAKPAGSGR
jgi:RND family efflux transporter MFP subunit